MGEITMSKECSHDQNFRLIDERNIRTFSLDDAKNLRQFLNNIGKHKDDCNFKILKLTCASVESSLNLMLKEWFSCGFKRATHWFFIIAEIECVFEDVNSGHLRLLQQRLGMSKPVMIQWKFSTFNKHLVYFKRSNEKDLIPLGVMEKTKLTEEELIEELTPQGIFSLPLLLKALLHGLGGHFSGDLSSTGFDVGRKFDGWRMIDYAARDDDDLLLRFLRLVQWDLAHKVSEGQRVLEIAAEYSSPQSVSAILDQPMIGTEGEQRLSYEQKKLLELVDDSSNTPLTIAVQKGRTETLKYLITCGADVHCRKKVYSKYFAPIHRAWENKFYDKVLALLKADSPFPEEYRLDNLSGANIVKLRKLTKIRINFHQNIINNNVSVVKDFISDYPQLRYAYNCNNQTALLVALKAGAFEIYALLESKKYLISNDEKVDFSNLIEGLSEQQKDKLKQAKLRYFGREEKSHIMYLLSKSRKFGGGIEDHTRIVRELFESLDEIPEISTVLKVIEHAEALDIIFDFNNDSIVDLDPTKCSATSGSCDFKVGRVYVGAKQPLEALGTLAHELTHLAMQTVFDNDCNPYTTSEETIKSQFGEIVDEYKDRNEMNDIIARVFTVYTNPKDLPSELIVRVPHLLAIHYKQKDDPQVLEDLREKAPELFSFYHENVQNRFKDFLRDPTFRKAQIKLERLNDLLGQLQTIQDSKIPLNPSSLFNKRQLDFNTILIISSDLPRLTKSELCQVLTYKKVELRNECIFTTVEHFRNDKQAREIHSSFQSLINPILIVDCSRDYDLHNRYMWEKIICVRERQRIVFIANSETANMIHCKLKSRSGTFEAKFQTNLIRRDYIWTDLPVESQHLLLETPVNFQGYPVALNKLIKCNNSSSLPQYIPFQDLLQGTPIKVGKPLSLSHGYDERFYIERSLNKSGDGIYFYLSINAEELYQQKLVFIADKVGTGKSTYLTHISKRIKEQNPECWVLKYDLNNHTDLLEEQQKTKMDALQFLRQKLIGLQTQFEKTLFENCLANNKVVLMLDGIDEISSGLENVVVDLVVDFLSSPIKQLWFTNSFRVTGFGLDYDYYLTPFSVENQVGFLSRFWTNLLVGYSQTLDHNRIRKYALEIVGLLSKSFQDNQKQSIGVPLLTRMLGEAFDKEFEEFYYSSCMELKLPEQLNIVGVYEKFFDRKYLRYFSEKKNVSNINLASEDVLRLLKGETNLRKIYQQLALESHFPEQTQNLLEFKKNHVLPPENLKRIGLVDYVGGKPKFIHRTFSEYFVIDFLICELEKTNQVYISDFLLNDILLAADHENMRAFLNSMLEKNMPSVQSKTFKWYGQRIVELWALGLLHNSEGTILHNAVGEGNQNIITFILESLKGVDQNKSTLKEIFLTRINLDQMKLKKTVWHILVENRNYFIIPKLVEWSEEAGLTHEEFKNIFFPSKFPDNLTVLHAAVYNDYFTLKKVFHLARTVFTKQEYKSLLLSRDMHGKTLFDDYALSSKDGVLIDILTFASEVFDLNDFKGILFAVSKRYNSTVWHHVADKGDLNAFDWFFSWSKRKLTTDDAKKSILKPRNSLWPSLAGRNSVEILEKFRKWSEDIKLDFKNDVLLSRNDNSEQAWHVAARKGNLTILEKLVEYCQDFGLNLADDLVLSRTELGLTTWLTAARYGHANVLEYLLRIAENLHLDLKNDLLLYKDNYGRNSWHLTAFGGDVRCMEIMWNLGNNLLSNVKEELLLSKDEDSNTAWFFSLFYKNHKSMELIWKISQELFELDELKDLFKTKDMGGYYLLHKMESFSNSDLLNKYWEYGLTVFDTEEFKEFFLLSQDRYGSNVCHRLVDNGDVKLIDDLWKLYSRLKLNMSDKKKLLLSKDNNGKTPFHCAASRLPGNRDIVEKLWEFAKATNFTSSELRSLIFDSDVKGYAAWPSKDAIIAKILWDFALDIGLDTKRELLMYKNSRNQTVWYLAIRCRSRYFLGELWELSKSIELTTEEYKLMFLERDWRGKTIWQVACKRDDAVLKMLKTFYRELGIDLQWFPTPTNRRRSLSYRLRDIYIKKV